MAKDRKIRLGIIFGGRSGEHEVSITSAASVIKALDPQEFEITAIGITKTGKLANTSEMRAMLPEDIQPRVLLSPALEGDGSSMTVVTDLPQERRDPRTFPQIIFPLLHGPYGEDGTIQGLLEIAGLPYIGCGVLASAVGMDKDVMKRLFLQAQLPVAPYRAVMARDLDKNMESLKQLTARELGYPMFSKPANLGSSVGICKIHNESEFEIALRHSAQFDRKILIEKGIDAREMECAILGNDAPRASLVGEVFSAHEFYDYDAKYRNPESRTEIPARIESSKAEEIRELALRSFKTIDGAGLARVDFFLERTTGKVWLNEINTMPGFTPISMYTKLWDASGVPFEQLVRRLVELGEERYREKAGQKISVG
ncbi:MAG TPA: D-alanine--D-alanine ligase family protein [Acidobacteriota bacterium]|nr:D-alanine--D-alanine ligase family protein [Acidobacteriota bacterium]